MRYLSPIQLAFVTYRALARGLCPCPVHPSPLGIAITEHKCLLKIAIQYIIQIYLLAGGYFNAKLSLQLGLATCCLTN